MKALNFNKNSWHYRLVKWLKLYEAPYEKDVWGDGSELRTYGDSADICTYSKKVVLALFLISIGIAFFVIVSNIAIHTLLGIYFSILAGRWFFTESGNVGAILFTTAVLWIGIYLSVTAISDARRQKVVKKKHDTFISNAYKSWEDKFCLPINFNE